MNDAGVLTSTKLDQAGFRHAFFTRQGGVSGGPYASLNFSFAVGDDPACVNENLRRASVCLDVQPERICFVSQVHGRRVVELESHAQRTSILQLEGDAVVARSGALACAVRTADCVPILLADPLTGAVAAIHSGWRGTVCNVVAAAVQALCRTPDRLIAAIGPHISRASFEVDTDVAATLQALVPGRPVVIQTPGQKPKVDLQQIVTAQLLGLGIPEERIDTVPGCTLAEPERFFSYRRDGRVSGRLLSAIVPKLSLV